MRGGSESRQRFRIGSAGNAVFCEDRSYVLVRRNVEGRVRRMHIGRDAHSLEFRDFRGRALFDGNVVAIGNR